MSARLLSIITLVTILALVVLTLLILGPRAANAGPTEHTPTPRPSPTRTAPPIHYPSPELIAWARHWRKAAVRQRVTLRRVRRCFGDSAPVQVADAPLRGASAETWRQAGRSWRRQCRDWAGKIDAGIWKMKHPGGSGASRWLPLCWYVGWPRCEAANIVYCLSHESGGNPNAISPTSDYGLFQINRCHHLRNPFDPLVNARFALRLWRSLRWGPWTTMRGRS